MYIEKVDEERYRVEITDKMGTRKIIVHKSQLDWYFNGNQLELNL